MLKLVTTAAVFIAVNSPAWWATYIGPTRGVRVPVGMVGVVAGARGWCCRWSCSCCQAASSHSGGEVPGSGGGR